MSLRHTLCLEEFYGVTKEMSAKLSKEVQTNYMKTVLIVAGADGLSASELEYAMLLQHACGVPDSALEELQQFADAMMDPGQSLIALGMSMMNEVYELKAADPALKRAVLYDAIRVASRDGYSQEERDRLHEVAALLGVPSETLIALESIVELEASLRKARLSILRGA